MGREPASSGSEQCERYRVEQHFDHLVLSERCGRHQRRPAVVVNVVHLGASPDQQPHALCMVVQGRYMHGRHSVLATPIDVVLVLLQERLQLGNITFACRLEEQDASTCTCEAQVVIEPRLGTLGADAHEVTYGIPSSSMLSQAASLVPTSPPIPTIPEISLAKKDDQTGAAKVAVFAYDAESGRPIWQSGTTTAKSTSRNLWIFGVGPFQSGSVHEGPKFAGAEMSLPQAEQKRKVRDSRQVISLGDAFLFGDLPKPDAESEIQQASAEEQAE